MNKIKAAVAGLGNTGLYAVKALNDSKDFECVGIIRRRAEDALIEGVKQYNTIEEIPIKPQVVILCLPSKQMPAAAEDYLKKGINVVDSFDIHTEVLPTVQRLDKIAKQNNAVAVVSGGWDPGSDSMVRAIFKIISPTAQIFTTFGPGMSMGHSVVARSIKGVKDAISMTLPNGPGKHKRKVYAQLDGTQTKEQVYASMKADNYFAHDPLEIEAVQDAQAYKNAAHGGHIEMQNGPLKADFQMTVNNPQTTAQILVACARAALRQTPGAYTLIDIPLVSFLEGEREDNIKLLV